MAVEVTTIAQLFEHQAHRLADRALLKEKRNKVWHEHSWRDLANEAARLRAGLIRCGVTAGDRVAILAGNGSRWVTVDQAALGLGAIVVPLYTASAADELHQILSDSGAKAIAVDGAANLEKLDSVLPRLKDPAIVVTMGSETIGDVGGCRIETMQSLSGGDPAPARAGSRNDLATFIYTSGTSGPPKGVMLSHGNLLANAEASQAALNLGESDMTLSFLPVAHAFERTAGHYTIMMAGGSIAYAEGLAQIGENLLETNPTVVLTVPRLLEVIYDRVMRTVKSSGPMRQRLFQLALAIGTRAAWHRHRGHAVPPPLALPMALFRKTVFARIRGIFGARIRYLISGGAPLPSAVFDLLAAAEVPIVEGYGLTEASPVVSVNLHGRTRRGTVGQPLNNVDARTAADGELLIRGPSVMQGYYKRKAETHEAIDADRWLHTGDICKIDAEGYIAIRDRKKEIIVLSGGKNVSPANLESRLTADPYIAQACVIGDGRKHLAALIVPDFEALKEYSRQNELGLGSPEALAGDGRVRAFYRRRIRELNRMLSPTEAITEFDLLAEAFSQENGELTPTLKVRRRIVQARYRDRVEALYRN